jgi:hypothetical protein
MMVHCEQVHSELSLAETNVLDQLQIQASGNIQFSFSHQTTQLLNQAWDIQIGLV